MFRRIIDKIIEGSCSSRVVHAIILFGSYVKGNNTENSDIDIAIVSENFDDIYDARAVLIGITWEIDARIEPHPIKKKIMMKYLIIL